MSTNKPPGWSIRPNLAPETKKAYGFMTRMKTFLFQSSPGLKNPPNAQSIHSTTSHSIPLDADPVLESHSSWGLKLLGSTPAADASAQKNSPLSH